jgi:hypothetical protein
MIRLSVMVKSMELPHRYQKYWNRHRQCFLGSELAGCPKKDKHLYEQFLFMDLSSLFWYLYNHETLIVTFLRPHDDPKITDMIVFTIYNQIGGKKFLTEIVINAMQNYSKGNREIIVVLSEMLNELKKANREISTFKEFVNILTEETPVNKKLQESVRKIVKVMVPQEDDDVNRLLKNIYGPELSDNVYRSENLLK